MSSLLFDLPRPSQRHGLRVSILSDFFSRDFGNVSDCGLSFSDSCLDIKPELKLVLLIKDAPHFGTAISASIDWKDGQSKSATKRAWLDIKQLRVTCTSL